MAIDNDDDFHKFIINHKDEFSSVYIEKLLEFLVHLKNETRNVKKRRASKSIVIDISTVDEYFPNISDKIKELIDQLQLLLPKN